MTAASLSFRSIEVGRLARRAVTWWVGELAGLLPRSVSERLVGGARPQATLEVSATQADLVIPARGRAAAVRVPLDLHDDVVAQRFAHRHCGLPIQIKLDAALILETAIELPMAAERSMEAILRNQLDRMVPLDPATLRFGWFIAKRVPARKAVKVGVVFARLVTLERAKSLATRFGLTPRTIVGGEGVPVSLWEARSAETTVGVRRWTRRTLEIVAALLLIGSHVLQIATLDARRAVLRASVAEARPRAAAVQALEQKAEQARKTLAFFAAKRDAATPLAVIDALTRAVPHDGWVSDLHLHGAEVQLTGYAPHATDFVARLEAVQLFLEPTFRSPVTTVQGGTGERFDIGFQVRMPAQ